MENRFDDNEFEQFLQDETRQHRMYPSDKIWRNIHNELHPKKDWHALTILGLFIICALTLSTILNNHPAQPFAKTGEIVEHQKSKTVYQEKRKPKYHEQFFANSLSSGAFVLLKEKSKEEEMADFENLIALQNPLVAIVPNINSAELVLYEPPIAAKETQSSESINMLLASNSKNIESEIEKRLEAGQTGSVDVGNTVVSNLMLPSQQVAVGLTKSSTISIDALQDERASKSFFKKPIDDNPTEEESNGYQPSVFLAKSKVSKFDFQFYITPSISYRKLIDDKERNSYQRASSIGGPSALDYAVGVNDVVRHKPAMGTEVGIGIMYQLTKNLKLKTGLQLNARQYYIDGFSSSTGLATIAIVSNNRLDTINQLSNFSNTNGYKESQLDNKLFQISMPIGLQWDFFQAKRLGFSIGGSLQPTMTLNKNLYIISTDYKLYTDGTPFLRRWNINSSAELNITYKVGNVKWYLGPQIRYQHLPTYTEKYPIKEYRLDYGLKIGFSKAL